MLMPIAGKKPAKEAAAKEAVSRSHSGSRLSVVKHQKPLSSIWTRTLLDSVDLHALAWQEALLRFGHDVSFEQVRGQIGKGRRQTHSRSSCPPTNNETMAKNLEEWRGDRFKNEYLPLVRPFSAVPNLLRRCAQQPDFRSQLLPRPRRMKSTSISTSLASPTWWI